MKWWLVIAAVVALVLALAGVACNAQSSGPQGEIVLRAVGPVAPQDMQRAVQLLRNRLDFVRAKPASVQQLTGNRIIIKLPRRFLRQADVLTHFAQLGLYDLEADVTGPSTDSFGYVVAESSLFHLLKQVQSDAKRGTPTAFYLFDAQNRLKRGPADTRRSLLSSPKLKGKVQKGWTVLAVPQHMTVVSCAQSAGCIGASQGNAPNVYYLFKNVPGRIPELTGKELKNGSISAQVGTQPGEGNAFVTVGFNRDGNAKFREITALEAARGQAAADAAGQGGSSDQATVSQFAQHFAIVLDGKLQSTPYIDYKQNPNGVDPSTNGAEISNIRTVSEAKDIALELVAGAALQVHFVRVR